MSHSKKLLAERARLAARAAAELCRCGRTPSPGYSQCERCNEYNRKYTRKRRTKLILRKMCVTCGTEPARNNMRSCVRCAQKYADIAYNNTHERRVLGLCIMTGCKANALPDYVHCEYHRQHNVDCVERWRVRRLAQQVAQELLEDPLEHITCDELRWIAQSVDTTVHEPSPDPVPATLWLTHYDRRTIAP